MGRARESLVSTVYRKIGGFVYGKYNGMFRACASSVYQASPQSLVGHLSNVNNIFVGNKSHQERYPVTITPSHVTFKSYKKCLLHSF